MIDVGVTVIASGLNIQGESLVKDSGYKLVNVGVGKQRQ